MSTETDTDTTMEHDEYLQIWTLTETSALECFGLTAAEYTVTVLKDAPSTAREIERYRPEAKLFGIKAVK